MCTHYPGQRNTTPAGTDAGSPAGGWQELGQTMQLPADYENRRRIVSGWFMIKAALILNPSASFRTRISSAIVLNHNRRASRGRKSCLWSLGLLDCFELKLGTAGHSLHSQRVALSAAQCNRGRCHVPSHSHSDSRRWTVPDTLHRATTDNILTSWCSGKLVKSEKNPFLPRILCQLYGTTYREEKELERTSYAYGVDGLATAMNEAAPLKL